MWKTSEFEIDGIGMQKVYRVQWRGRVSNAQCVIRKRSETWNWMVFSRGRIAEGTASSLGDAQAASTRAAGDFAGTPLEQDA